MNHVARSSNTVNKQADFVNSFETYDQIWFMSMYSDMTMKFATIVVQRVPTVSMMLFIYLFYLFIFLIF